MADYNPAVAANVQSVNLTPVLQAVMNAQLVGAHTGLYSLQAAQQARQYNALQSAAAAYRGGQDPVGAYLASGGDPSGATALQTVSSGQKAMGMTPGGILPSQYGELTKANANNVNAFNVGSEASARIAAGVLADPRNDQVWHEAVNQHYNTYGGNPLERQQLLNTTDPNQRLAIARAYSGQGVSPADVVKPVSVTPGNPVYSTGQIMSGQGFQTAPTPVQTAQPGQPTASQPANTARPASPTPSTAPIQPVQPGAPQPIIPGLTPFQKEMQTQQAQKTVDYLQGEGSKSYSNAQSLMGSLTNVEHDIDALGPQNMGTFANAKMTAVKGLNTIFNQFGISQIDPTKIANWEEFNKETIRAGMQLINSNFGGSREAASIIQMGKAAVPGVENSYLGAKYVSATIKAAAQRQIDLYEYQAAHPDQLPAVSAIQFNKAHPPQQYAMAGIASAIPQGAKQYLTAHPETASQFNKNFGSGMAQFILTHP